MISHNVQKNYMKHPSILEGDVLDIKLLYSPLNDKFYALNISAYLIWTLLDQQGAFGTGSEAGALRILKSWFLPPLKNATIIKDIDFIVEKFISENLLIKRPESITLSYTSCSIHENNSPTTYIEPKMTIYDSEWMKDNHPYYYHSITYSDLWSPSST